MSDFKKYPCMECEHSYDEAKGDPDSWDYPICGASKSFFKLMDSH